MSSLPSVRDALSHLHAGQRVYVAGCCGEPTSFLDAIAAEPERAAGVTFTGVLIPGVNRRDPSDGVPGASIEVFFVTPELTPGFRQGRVRLLPLHYSAISRHLVRPGLIDLAVMRVSPPNDDGQVSCGIAADFGPTLEAAGVPMIAEIDEAMPFVADGPTVSLDRFQLAYAAVTPMPTLKSEPVSPALATVAGRIAGLVRPGDTIQLGLGKLQRAVLEALTGHRELNYHGGMISDEAMPLIERNILTRVTTGTALGGAALPARAAASRQIRWRPVSHTHHHATLAAIDNFVAINATLAVDLNGQCVSDALNGRQVSGVGGLVDFQRGALASAGGRPIIALAATTPDGSVSRIVPRLDGTTVSIARADAGIVVTEFGVADCRDLDLDARAQALITIAAPQHRDGLANEWDRLRRAM